MARYRKDIADGMQCTDCVGLFKSHYWEKDGKLVYNAATDVSAGGMFDRSPIRGLIKDLPEVPGLVLYAPGHVGAYEGNGYVIEAKGFAYGVIRSKVSEGKWTHYCVCPYISYAGFEDLLTPAPITEPYTAQVVTQTSPLNIWNDCKKTRSLLAVKKGDTVTVLGYADMPGWFKVRKGTVNGMADSRYLQKTGTPALETDGDDTGLPETNTPEVPAPEDVKYQARVVNVKSGLNLRTKPDMNATTLLLLPKDTVVEVLKDNVGNGFSHAHYGGIYGYCTRSYLYQLDNDAPQFYTVVLRSVTEDVMAQVLKLCPAAEVTKTN